MEKIKTEKYYLTKNDLNKIEDGKGIYIISKDGRHIEILFNNENE
jgi:hypothetical protein